MERPAHTACPPMRHATAAAFAASALLAALGAVVGLLLGRTPLAGAEGAAMLLFAAAVLLGPLYAKSARRDDGLDEAMDENGSGRRW